MEDESRPIMLDASAYMLVEATGDSESDYCHTAAQLAAAEADVAESCSSTPHQNQNQNQIDGGGTGTAVEFLGFDDYLEEGKGSGSAAEEEEEEEGVVDQSHGGPRVEEMNKSKGGGGGCDHHSNMKLMSEKEMDRLFWEACLAS